jgi:hypothetical protein
VTTRRGKLALGALAAAAVSLIAIELALGALGFGEARLAEPCTSKPAFDGGGIDGALQRLVLSGLDGAACDLKTSREALVLSFSPSAKTKIEWDSATRDSALQAGFDRAARDTAGDGLVGKVVATLLRELVAHPLEWLLDR